MVAGESQPKRSASIFNPCGQTTNAYSLATTRYYSASPIRFGAYAVHYALTPHARADAGATAGASPEYLAEDLSTRLRAGPAKAQAQLYADLARDIQGNRRTVPGLEHALDRHRLIDAIGRASASGTSQRVASLSTQATS